LANPYISSEREAAHYDLGVSWSVLDFTVGYYQARQNADRILIAAEHRRKAMHALSREVAIAFWRMASAQQLLTQVRTAIQRAETALADAALAQQEGLRSPVENLRYQRQLLENIRLLSTIEKEFSTARSTLGTLINAPVGSAFTVVEPGEAPSVAILDVPVEQMEELALWQNADLKEQLYQIRIARAEVRKSFARALPGLSLNYGVKHNTDDFLINNSWQEAGLLLSQNLTALLALPANKRVADGGVALAEQRRLAFQMAVLAQVHIARLELASAHRQLQLADRIWTIDEGIKQHTDHRATAQTEGQLAQVAADTASIVGLLRRYQALAEFNAAASSLQATLGLEIDVDSVDQQSLDELTRSVARWRRSWQAGQLPTLPQSL
jgi:outer membrane protein TolC